MAFPSIVHKIRPNVPGEEVVVPGAGGAVVPGAGVVAAGAGDCVVPWAGTVVPAAGGAVVPGTGVVVPCAGGAEVWNRQLIAYTWRTWFSMWLFKMHY